jgi:hypothetical protein
VSEHGYLWCAVCRTFRPVQHGLPYCHRCGWDMRAAVASKLDIYRAWLRRERGEPSDD